MESSREDRDVKMQRYAISNNREVTDTRQLRGSTTSQSKKIEYSPLKTPVLESKTLSEMEERLSHAHHFRLNPAVDIQRSISLETEVSARKSQIYKGSELEEYLYAEDKNGVQYCGRCEELRAKLESLRIEREALTSALKARTVLANNSKSTSESTSKSKSTSSSKTATVLRLRQEVEQLRTTADFLFHQLEQNQNHTKLE
mmetsp:Transcript_3853/g.6731  ORF Transcript_3853/g.6731 Transcript_3853/m.6731 type:complete len:201 (-) Transcript_3853:826-1428(-)